MVFEDDHGLVFWPEHLVASLTPDFDGRWRAVMHDGSVAHGPGPTSEAGWQKLGNALVRPELLQKTADGWKDPAGFDFPPGELSASPPPEPLPQLPELPCRRESIWALESRQGRHTLWRTDEGDFLWKRISPLRAAALLPEVFRAKKGLHLNRQRLRRVSTDAHTFYLHMDNGEVHDALRPNVREHLPAALGLTSLPHLEPYRRELYEPYGWLRDWPFDLTRASGLLLQSLFSGADELIAQLIWQRFRQRSAGLPREWSDSYRGFWYDLAPPLFRAGFLHRLPGEEEPPPNLEPPPDDEDEQEEPQGSRSLWIRLFEVMGFLIKARLFSYQQFGFVDPHPELTIIGTQRPEVVLVAEKDAFHEAARRLGEEFGVTVYLLGGTPSMLRSEHLARRLALVLKRQAVVVGYTDHDAGGWVVSQTAVDHLSLFGIDVRPDVIHMVKESSFTPEELRLYAHPCSLGSAKRESLVRNWVKQGGGIDGRPWGIHSDHVQPFARVRQLFVEAMTELEAGPRSSTSDELSC